MNLKDNDDYDCIATPRSTSLKSTSSRNSRPGSSGASNRSQRRTRTYSTQSSRSTKLKSDDDVTMRSNNSVQKSKSTTPKSSNQKKGMTRRRTKSQMDLDHSETKKEVQTPMTLRKQPKRGRGSTGSIQLKPNSPLFSLSPHEIETEEEEEEEEEEGMSPEMNEFQVLDSILEGDFHSRRSSTSSFPSETFVNSPNATLTTHTGSSSDATSHSPGFGSSPDISENDSSRDRHILVDYSSLLSEETDEEEGGGGPVLATTRQLSLEELLDDESEIHETDLSLTDMIEQLHVQGWDSSKKTLGSGGPMSPIESQETNLTNQQEASFDFLMADLQTMQQTHQEPYKSLLSSPEQSPDLKPSRSTKEPPRLNLNQRTNLSSFSDGEALNFVSTQQLGSILCTDGEGALDRALLRLSYSSQSLDVVSHCSEPILSPPRGTLRSSDGGGDEWRVRNKALETKYLRANLKSAVIALRSVHAERNDLEANLDRLKEDLSTMGEDDSSNRRLTEQEGTIQELEGQLRREKELKEKFKVDWEKQQETIQTLKRELDLTGLKRERCVAGYEEEQRSLESKFNLVQSELSQRHEKQLEVEKAYTKLMTDMKENHQGLLKEKEEAVSKVALLELELFDAEAQVKYVKEENEKESNLRIEERKEQMKRENIIKEQDEVLSVAKAEIDLLEKEKLCTSVMISTLQEELNEEKNDRRKLENGKLQSVMRERNEKDQQIHLLQSNVHALENESEQRAEEIKSLKNDLEVCHGFEEHANTLRLQLDEKVNLADELKIQLEEKISTLDNTLRLQLDEKVTLADGLKIQLEEKISTIDELQREHCDEIRNRNEETSTQLQDKDDLKGLLKDATCKISELESKLQQQVGVEEQTKLSLASLENGIRDKIKDIDGLKQELSDKNDKMKSLICALHTSEEDAKELRTHIADRELTLSSFEKEMKLSKDEIDSLKGKNKYLLVEQAKASNENKNEKVRNEELAFQLQASQSEIGEIRKCLKSFKEDKQVEAQTHLGKISAMQDKLNDQFEQIEKLQTSVKAYETERNRLKVMTSENVQSLEELTDHLDVVSEKLLVAEKDLSEKEAEIDRHLNCIENLRLECEERNIAFETEQREKKMLQLEIQHLQKIKNATGSKNTLIEVRHKAVMVSPEAKVGDMRSKLEDIKNTDLEREVQPDGDIYGQLKSRIRCVESELESQKEEANAAISDFASELTRMTMERDSLLDDFKTITQEIMCSGIPLPCLGEDLGKGRITEDEKQTDSSYEENTKQMVNEFIKEIQKERSEKQEVIAELSKARFDIKEIKESSKKRELANQELEASNQEQSDITEILPNIKNEEIQKVIRELVLEIEKASAKGLHHRESRKLLEKSLRSISGLEFSGVTCDEDGKEPEKGQTSYDKVRLHATLQLLDEKQMELADVNGSKSSLEANVEMFHERLRNILVFHVKQRRSPEAAERFIKKKRLDSQEVKFEHLIEFLERIFKIPFEFDESEESPGHMLNLQRSDKVIANSDKDQNSSEESRRKSCASMSIEQDSDSDSIYAELNSIVNQSQFVLSSALEEFTLDIKPTQTHFDSQDLFEEYKAIKRKCQVLEDERAEFMDEALLLIETNAAANAAEMEAVVSQVKKEATLQLNEYKRVAEYRLT